METLGIQGANITMPLKTDCIAYAKKTSVVVKKIGAANLLIRENNSLSAFNTDMFGVFGKFSSKRGIHVTDQHALRHRCRRGRTCGCVGLGEDRQEHMCSWQTEQVRTAHIVFHWKTFLNCFHAVLL